MRTPDHERIASLDDLPSPYLTGEFDEIHVAAWDYCLPIETTRGCPYGCTFCDWGSSTMSRIRKFDIDRVTAEIEWAAARGVKIINIPDANFGIMSRDVELARRIADVKRRTGLPELIGYYPAKNTTKHLVEIMDVLMGAGIGPSAPLSLQSTDDATLAAVERHNISTRHYVALAAAFRRRRLPLQAELIFGLPGQTYGSYKADLQFMLDHEIIARSWPCQILPNSPMNEPGYRERFAIEQDDRHVVVATSTFTRDDRRRMIRLRDLDAITERYGLLRHVMRYLQWDHGIAALDVVERLLDVVDEDPSRYPSLGWVATNFDLLPAPAVGWTTFYDDVRRFLADEFGVERSSGLDCVLAVQQFLMPVPGRSFPATLALAHDYVAYYRAATADLYSSGAASVAPTLLEDHGPAILTIEDDPLDLCRRPMTIPGDSRNERLPGDFVLGVNSALELRSPLMRLLPWVAFHKIEPPGLAEQIAQGEAIAQASAPDEEPASERVPVAVRVALDATRS